MSQDLLVDTDVLVDYLRGNDAAVAYVQQHADRIAVSAITVAELYAGVRPTQAAPLDELTRLFPVLPVDRETATVGGQLRAEYGRSHGVGLADALVAATARRHGMRLVTANVRHFPMFPDLTAPYRKA